MGTVLNPAQAYVKVIEYGIYKKKLRPDVLVLQGFTAGIWITIYVHSILKFASGWYDPESLSSTTTANGMFGLLLTGAFMALMITGSELYTGNTAAMVLLVLQHGLHEMAALCKVWGCSILGNLLGCVVGGYLFSKLSGDFENNSQALKYLMFFFHKKLSNTFGHVFILGIGCNSLICLATWCHACFLDGAGKILAMAYCVAVFVIGGYEHIIVNFYLLHLGIFVGDSDYNYGQVIYKNFIPAYLGNTFAGVVFTALIWWFTYHPAYTNLTTCTDAELIHELSSRHNHAEKETSMIGGNPTVYKTSKYIAETENLMRKSTEKTKLSVDGHDSAGLISGDQKRSPIP